MAIWEIYAYVSVYWIISRKILKIDVKTRYVSFSDQFVDNQKDKSQECRDKKNSIPRTYPQGESELKGNNSRSSLPLSSSSPSLTEYVRQHLSPLQIPAGPDSSLLSPLAVQELVGVWNPQFGSPKLPFPSPSSVDFTLGDEDEELLSVNNLNLAAAASDIHFQILEKDRHHFSSMIQRNSTMPDLQSQTVSCMWPI